MIFNAVTTTLGDAMHAHRRRNRAHVRSEMTLKTLSSRFQLSEPIYPHPLPRGSSAFIIGLKVFPDRLMLFNAVPTTLGDVMHAHRRRNRGTCDQR